MRNDEELLDLSAKAAGIQYDDFDEDKRCDIWFIPETSRYSPWNPLEDDGDAFRLAVKLGLATSVCKGMPTENFTVILGTDVKEVHGEDEFSATRRAVVRAAANIGEDM